MGSGNIKIIISVGYLFQDYLSGLTQVGNIFNPGNNLVYGVWAMFHVSKLHIL